MLHRAEEESSDRCLIHCQGQARDTLYAGCNQLLAACDTHAGRHDILAEDFLAGANDSTDHTGVALGTIRDGQGRRATARRVDPGTGHRSRNSGTPIDHGDRCERIPPYAVRETAGFGEQIGLVVNPYDRGVDSRQHLQHAAESRRTLFGRTGVPSQLRFGQRTVDRWHESHRIRLQNVVDGASAQRFDRAFLAYGAR